MLVIYQYVNDRSLKVIRDIERGYSENMRVAVKVIAHASRDAIEKLGEGKYKVWVRALPEKGRANEMVARLLALEFEVAMSQVRLVSGPTSAQKVFEILGA